MRKIFVISDTHFGHENIIQFCNRPFANVDLMDECLCDNWNSVVGDDDIVYHLGDVFFNKSYDNLYKLKGRKRLILGNHDDAKHPHIQKCFEKVMVWRKWPEFKCILTHIPLHESSLLPSHKYDFQCYVNIHGHIHDKESPPDHYINACVEWHDYKPVELEELLQSHYEKSIRKNSTKVNAKRR